MPSVTAAIAAGTSIAGSAMSFAQAAEQSARIKAAEAAAQKAMDDARKMLDINVYKGVEIDLLPFNMQREDLAAVGGQAITAAGESGRGASETAGRVLAATQEQERQTTSDLSKELQNLNLLAAQEESSLQSKRAELELAEASGAQQATADAERSMNAAIASGISGLADFGLTLYSESPLYKPEKTDKTQKNKKLNTKKALPDYTTPPQNTLFNDNSLFG